MEKEAILRILQEDIHSTIAATLGEDGHPQTRAIDIMLIEDGKPIFLTARGKAFYDQLITQKFIALSGVKAGISVSLRGQVRPADPGLLDLAFERNPYMQRIYPGTTRQALVMFELYEGRVSFRSQSAAGLSPALYDRRSRTGRHAVWDHSEVRRLRRLFECLSAAVY